ncbi:hypothetical protein HMPREF1624_05725 [Sporothrix schenckii ATCC 58251]|uniref:Non-ribosomal peptide synthetase n=1 Tax=Sporothrix schenckii (strain ATCC 58251 / de Perez 2211183) TaxID=1391915 RepID=U7PS32_SPOS1|nr:hypothetical protein HMPREF1624_05725 [Sporothrix schenckii ATCC 58251]
MAAPRAHRNDTSSSSGSHDDITPVDERTEFVDLEKNLSDTNTPSSPTPAILETELFSVKSFQDDGITLFSPHSTPELALAWPPGWTKQTASDVPDHGRRGKVLSKRLSTKGSTPKTDPKTKPAKPQPKVGRWLRFRLWLNTYRGFFIFVTLLNLVGIVLAATGHFPYADNHLGALVLGNLLCAILMRNELFLRCLYTLSIYGLRSWAPVRVKLAVTSVLQHVGGIHSGCALSGAGWLLFKVVDIVLHRAVQPDSVLATGVVTNVCVMVSILSAFPWVRNNHHNTFERYHRFIGWLGLAATWVFVILGNTYDLKLGAWRADAHSLLAAQEMWFAAFMTIFVIIPWVTLREVPVEVELPSPKVAILRFKRGMQQGLLGRISRTSLMEYHAFGIISEGRTADHHFMICGVQGDFTKGLVSDPPKTVWTRELKFAGVGHASAMFKRGIRICTGTGIGAALSTCIQSKNWFLIWIGSDQEKTFGPTITGLIHKHIEPERMILWDSKKRGGRPNSVQLLKDTWTSFGAEVIFITSNMQGNDEMMQGCREAGMHAFGTLWDF